MNRSRMIFDALKNIEIEPKLHSNVEFRINLENVLGCFDFYSETQDKFVFTFRPQSRPSDGLVEAFMKHSEHWKPHSVLLILDYDGYIDPDIVPHPWKDYFVEIIQIHAPDGCINKDDRTNISSAIERVFNAKKRDVDDVGTVQVATKRPVRKEYDQLLDVKSNDSRWRQLWTGWQRMMSLILNCFVSGWHSVTSLRFIRKSLTALVLIICYCWYFLLQLPRIAAEILAKIKRFFLWLIGCLQ